MKKQILFSIIAILMMSMTVLAHAPKKIILTFDKATNTLKADMIHKVKDINSHYISKVTIYVNGDEVQVATFEKQAEILNEESDFILENIKSGDEIKLVAKCNKFGKKAAKIVVE